MEFRRQYGYDVKEASDAAADIGPYGESLTVQSQAEDADLNVLMKRFGITHKLPDFIPQWGDLDFTGVSDFGSALRQVEAAREAFALIPAEVRARFDNDPGRLLLACQDPSQLPLLRELGLAKALAVEPAGSASPPATPAAQ